MLDVVFIYEIVPGLMAVRVQPGGVGAAVAALGKEPSVLYAEPDSLRCLMSQQTPYGVQLIYAPAVWAQGGSGAGGNSRGQGVRVAVLDSGISLHPDLPPLTASATFVPGPIADLTAHATHCAGIVCALDNDVGVVGAAPGADLMLGKVGLADGSIDGSAAIAGLNWAVLNGAKVVSMSFGGGGFFQADQDAMNAAAAAGVVLVAAAGNDGPDGDVNYPAGYANVIAVQAVDSAQAVASFGQRGAHIALSAPGVDVLSTVPQYSPAVYWFGPAGFNAPPATRPGDSRLGLIDGTIIDCGYGLSAADFPPAVNGNIALIRRGTPADPLGSSLCTKAGTAALAGARAIIFSQSAGGDVVPQIDQICPSSFYGGPPVLVISQNAGAALRAAAPVNGSAYADAITGYTYALDSGTSMATPYVAGVAALLMGKYARYNPTPAQVRQALFESATDLGAPGRDTTYGYGLVNASAAVARLGRILCLADFDRSGARTIDDIFVFLSAWFNGCTGQAGAPCNGLNADIDGVNGRTIDDIFIFLSMWFAGC